MLEEQRKSTGQPTAGQLSEEDEIRRAIEASEAEERRRKNQEESREEEMIRLAMEESQDMERRQS